MTMDGNIETSGDTGRRWNGTGELRNKCDIYN